MHALWLVWVLLLLLVLWLAMLCATVATRSLSWSTNVAADPDVDEARSIVHLLLLKIEQEVKASIWILSTEIAALLKLVLLLLQLQVFGIECEVAREEENLVLEAESRLVYQLLLLVLVVLPLLDFTSVARLAKKPRKRMTTNEGHRGPGPAVEPPPTPRIAEDFVAVLATLLSSSMVANQSTLPQDVTITMNRQRNTDAGAEVAQLHPAQIGEGTAETVAQGAEVALEAWLKLPLLLVLPALPLTKWAREVSAKDRKRREDAMTTEKMAISQGHHIHHQWVRTQTLTHLLTSGTIILLRESGKTVYVFMSCHINVLAAMHSHLRRRKIIMLQSTPSFAHIIPPTTLHLQEPPLNQTHVAVILTMIIWVILRPAKPMLGIIAMLNIVVGPVLMM